MAELPGGASPDREEAHATAPLAGKVFHRQLRLGGDAHPLNDGPDYVDDWMRENLAPSIVEFVRCCCTSFVRWDLLRQLHADRTAMTAEELARAVGANHVTAASELESLASAGLVVRRRRGARTTYQLEDGSTMGQTLDAVVRAYDQSREFRFALVYSIVRASHRGDTLD